MRKLLALAVVAAFVLGSPAMAVQTKPTDKSEHVRGTITAWDDASKTLKVKDEHGKEWEFSVNDQTKLMGTPKAGDSVTLRYTKDKDGKMWATRVTVGKPEPEKSSKKP